MFLHHLESTDSLWSLRPSVHERRKGRGERDHPLLSMALLGFPNAFEKDERRALFVSIDGMQSNKGFLSELQESNASLSWVFRCQGSGCAFGCYLADMPVVERCPPPLQARHGYEGDGNLPEDPRLAKNRPVNMLCLTASSLGACLLCKCLNWLRRQSKGLRLEFLFVGPNTILQLIPPPGVPFSSYRSGAYTGALSTATPRRSLQPDVCPSCFPH